MPKQVFAEEIERFLGTLDGVGSARVVTTPGGDIAHVYVTADPGLEGRTVRRAVAAALSTTYGLPIEPWRIQVVQFRSGILLTEIPQFRVLRVEETVAATEMTAAVHLAWARGGEEEMAIGRARGPAGPANRLRTLAAATLDAARASLEPEHRRVALEQVSVVNFMDRPVTLVGISVPSPRGQEFIVGSSLEEEGAPDPAILAALGAMTKWFLAPAANAAVEGQHQDRRAELEAMRHYVRSAERGGTEGPEGPAEENGISEEALIETIWPRSDRKRDTLFGPHIRPIPRRDVPPRHDTPPRDESRDVVPLPLRPRENPPTAVKEIAEVPDVRMGLSQIRSENRGGAEMAAQVEPSRAGVAPPRGGRPSMEDAFYHNLVEGHTLVHLRCRDGYEIDQAIVKDVGTYTLLLETGAGTELVYKHAIISIRLLIEPTAEA